MSRELEHPDLASDPGTLASLVLNSLNAGVYVTDADRRIVFWNAAAERMTGWQACDVIGKTCRDQVLCHVDKDNRSLCGEEFCPLHRAIATGTDSDVPIIVYARSSTGQRVPMRVSVAPLRDQAGNVIGGVETFLDMSAEVADLRRAQQIQSHSLINDAANDPRLDVKVHYAPHDIIGGDFCAISRAGEDRYAFILADVMGHGLSAALYTMYLRSLWDDQCSDSTPAAILTAINQRLAAVISGGGAFATALCGVLKDDGSLSLASAGGPAPLLYQNGEFQTFPTLSGLPLGLVRDSEYEQIERRVVDDGRLLLFSDGVVETKDRDDKLLNTEGLLGLLRELQYPGVDLDMRLLEERLLTFSNAIRFSDDVTLIEIRRKSDRGPQENGASS